MNGTVSTASPKTARNETNAVPYSVPCGNESLTCPRIDDCHRDACDRLWSQWPAYNSTTAKSNAVRPSVTSRCAPLISTSVEDAIQVATPSSSAATHPA